MAYEGLELSLDDDDDDDVVVEVVDDDGRGGDDDDDDDDVDDVELSDFGCCKGLMPERPGYFTSYHPDTEGHKFIDTCRSKVEGFLFT
jgi:hypothetical protein